MMGSSRDDDEAKREPWGHRAGRKTYFLHGLMRMLFYDYFMVCGTSTIETMMKWKVFFSPIPGAVSTARTPRRLASLESRGWNESIFGGKKTQMGARSSWPKHYRRMGRALRRLSTLSLG